MIAKSHMRLGTPPVDDPCSYYDVIEQGRNQAACIGTAEWRRGYGAYLALWRESLPYALSMCGGVDLAAGEVATRCLEDGVSGRATGAQVVACLNALGVEAGPGGCLACYAYVGPDGTVGGRPDADVCLVQAGAAASVRREQAARGICTPPQLNIGGRCTCPEGWIKSGTTCARATGCPSGSFVQAGRCMCPYGTALRDGACLCPDGSVPTATGLCAGVDAAGRELPICPEGSDPATNAWCRASTETSQSSGAGARSWLLFGSLGLAGVVLLAVAAKRRR